MGRSGSSSQANQSTTTSNQDNRVTNRDGIVLGNGAGLDMSSWLDNSMRVDVSDSSNRSTNLSSWDASNNSTNSWDGSNRSTNTWDSSNRSTTNTTTNTTLDGGVIGKAFDFAKGLDATQGGVMADVLGLADRLSARSTDSATNLASRFQDNVLQAYDGAKNTTPGGIDNKTMIVMAVAGAVAVMAMSKRG